MNTSAGKLNGLALWSGDLATIGQAIMSMAHGMQLVGPFVEATDRAPVFDSLYHRALAQAQRLSKLVDDWQSTHALFEREAADSLTSATFVSLQNNYENLLSMLVQDTDLSGLTNVSSTDSAATYQLDLVDSGLTHTAKPQRPLRHARNCDHYRRPDWHYCDWYRQRLVARFHQSTWLDSQSIT